MYLHKSRAIVPKHPQQDSAYSCVKIEELWTLVDTPAELNMLKPAMATFRSRVCRLLADQVLAIMEQEIVLSKNLGLLTMQLRGDSPDTIDLQFDENQLMDLTRIVEVVNSLSLGIAGDFE